MIDKRLATLVVGNKIFFFNEEGRYTSVSVNEARKMDFINVQFKHFGAYLEYMPKNKLCAICGIGNYHGNYYALERALLWLREGESFEELKENIRRFYIEKSKISNMRNIVLKHEEDKCFFFDSKGRYLSVCEEQIFQTSVIDVGVDGRGGVWFYEKLRTYPLQEIGMDDRKALKMAISKLKIGDSLSILRKNYYKIKKMS